MGGQQEGGKRLTVVRWALLARATGKPAWACQHSSMPAMQCMMMMNADSNRLA